MKKLCSLLLVLCLLLSLSACGGNETATDNDNGSSTTQNQTDVTDTTSTEQDTDSSGSTTDTVGSLDSTDAPSSTTSTPSTTTESETSNPSTTTKPETSNPSTTTKPETSTPSTTTKPTESKPTHTHSYSAATCTSPQKCSCGETKGTALGHKWQDATCKAPKTCSVCKLTEGDKTKHIYNEDGICSVCSSKDPNFTYPILTSMNGIWKSYHKEGDYLIELNHHFLTNPSEVMPYGAVEWCYAPKEKIELGEGESLNDYESIVWEGTTYYRLGGGFVMEGVFEESNDKIIVTDYYSSNKQMVLQRISTNTMKVVSFDSEIEYVKIPIGTILNFSKN